MLCALLVDQQLTTNFEGTVVRASTIERPTLYLVDVVTTFIQ